MVFDVGGTGIKYAVMDDKFNMSSQGYAPTPTESFEDFSKLICDVYKQHEDEVEGIAMSILGFVDSRNGKITGGGNLQYNWGRNVAKDLEDICGCKVVIENDGKSAAVAEYSVGSLQGCSNAAVIVLGTGVGGGLIINGEVFRGIHNTAGEFSFMNFDPDIIKGPTSFLAYHCSTRGMLDMYKKATGTDEDIDGREFFRRLESDEVAQKVLDDVAQNLAIVIFNLFWLLDVERVAIGGGISRQSILIDKINEKFSSMISGHPQIDHLPVSDFRIVQATYGNDANLIGAYMTYKNRK